MAYTKLNLKHNLIWLLTLSLSPWSILGLKFKDMVSLFYKVKFLFHFKVNIKGTFLLNSNGS
jgi:hypothetical protein